MYQKFAFGLRVWNKRFGLYGTIYDFDPVRNEYRVQVGLPRLSDYRLWSASEVEL